MRFLPDEVVWWFRTLTRSGRQKWLDHELAADGPRGVRIVHADGRVTECVLVRDPEDREGCAQWIAVPPEGTVFAPPGDRLHVDYMPGRTAISVVVRPSWARRDDPGD